MNEQADRPSNEKARNHTASADGSSALFPFPSPPSTAHHMRLRETSCRSRMWARREFLGAAALGLLSLAIPGCAQNSSVDQGSQNDPDSREEADQPTDEIEETSGLIAKNQTITAAFSDKPLDVASMISPIDVSDMWATRQCLYTYSPIDFEVKATVATARPRAESDVEWVVSLRTDLVFENDRPLTAEDVVASLEVYRTRPFFSALLSFLSSVESKKKDELLITTTGAVTEEFLRRRLALVPISPAEEVASLSEDAERMPNVGSGPWLCEDDSEGLFTPNPLFDGTVPDTDLSWSVTSDARKRVEGLTTGTFAVVEDALPGQRTSIEEAGCIFESQPGYGMSLLTFNTQREPTSDKRVRQALLYGIDFDRIASEELEELASPATGLLPTWADDYQRNEVVYSFDATRARDLLNEARVRNPQVSLIVQTGNLEHVAHAIARDWSYIGVEAEVLRMDAPHIHDMLSPEQTAEGDLDFDVLLSDCNPSCFGNDIDFFLTWLFGDTPWTQGFSCWAKTPEWSRLQRTIDRARAATDAEKRKRLYQICLDLVAKEVPLYPLFHHHVSSAYNPELIRDYTPPRTPGLWFYGATAV